MNIKKISLLLTSMWIFIPQQNIVAQVYTCIQNGQTIYTSKRINNCHSAELPKIGSYSSEAVPTPKISITKANTTPNPAPKKMVASYTPNPVAVTPPSNTNTNHGRRLILEQELANERKALANEQTSLSHARSSKDSQFNQELITQLQGTILDRQQNIQALQRELSRM